MSWWDKESEVHQTSSMPYPIHTDWEFTEKKSAQKFLLSDTPVTLDQGHLDHIDMIPSWTKLVHKCLKLKAQQSYIFLMKQIL